MRILLDESLPKELQSELPGHEVRTVQEMGWSSLKNGELLSRGAGHFDAFLTADQNIQYQQNLSTLAVSVVVGRKDQPDPGPPTADSAATIRPVDACPTRARSSRRLTGVAAERPPT